MWPRGSPAPHVGKNGSQDADLFQRLRIANDSARRIVQIGANSIKLRRQPSPVEAKPKCAARHSELPKIATQHPYPEGMNADWNPLAALCGKPLV